MRKNSGSTRFARSPLSRARPKAKSRDRHVPDFHSECSNGKRLECLAEDLERFKVDQSV
jgi:hypothetical protein